MRATKGCDPARGSESQKGAPGSDWGLQLDPMKAESLVIADQQRCGEYVPGPCTQLKARGSVEDEVVRIHSCDLNGRSVGKGRTNPVTDRLKGLEQTTVSTIKGS